MTTIVHGSDALVYGADALIYGADPTTPAYTTVYLYDGATEHNITSEVYAVSVTRGRDRELDEINAGHCTIRCRNQSGNFNPYFVTTNEYLLLETSTDFLLQEDNSQILLESGGASAGDYGVMQPGRRIVIKDGTVTVFDGLVEDFDYEWRPGRFADVSILGVDGLAILAKQKIVSDWTTTDSQLTGARILELLALAEVDYSWAASTAIDAGLSVLQDAVVTVGTNVLTEAQLVAKCEQGRFFVSRANVLHFDGRDALASGTIVADFRDDGTGIPFSGIEVTSGSELLFTSVTVQNAGGVAQSVTDASAKANFRDRQLSLTGMILLSDEHAEDMANYLLGRYKAPEATVSQIMVKLDKLSLTDRATVAGIEIGDVVTLNWTPTPGLGAVTQTLVVEGVGYDEQINAAAAMTFQLSEAATQTGFILDSATLGVLDQNALGW